MIGGTLVLSHSFCVSFDGRVCLSWSGMYLLSACGESPIHRDFKPFLHDLMAPPSDGTVFTTQYHSNTRSLANWPGFFISLYVHSLCSAL